MITFSFRTPPGSSRGPIVLVMLLQKENLDRMREADPLDIQLVDLDINAMAKDLDIVIAYEEDDAQIAEMVRRHNRDELMKWLERGRKIRPETGDLTKPVRVPFVKSNS